MLVSLWQRVVLALQLVTLLATELSKLVAEGGTALIPPEGTPGVRVRTEDAELELRLHVRRIR